MSSEDITIREEKSKNSDVLNKTPLLRPRWIWLAFVFLGGLFSAALLLALNWRTMGYRRKSLSMLLMMLILWTLGAFVVIRATNHLPLDRDYTLNDMPTLQLVVVYFGHQFVAAIIIAWQIWEQWPVLRPFLQQEHRTSEAPIAWTVGAGVVIGFVVWPLVWTYLLLPLANQFTARFTPGSTYTDQGITMTYPAHWEDHTRGAWFDETCAGNHKETCVTFMIGNGVILESHSGPDVILNEASFYQTDGFQPLDKTYFKVDGRDAVRQTYIYRVMTTYVLIGNQVAIQNGDELVSLKFIAPLPLAGDVDAMLESIRFIEPVEE